MDSQPEKLKHVDWTADDRAAKRRLSFHLFNGRVSIYVRDTGAQFGAKPLFGRSFTWVQIRAIEKNIRKVMDAAPETKISLQGLKFDIQSKQSRVEWVVTIEKDSKQVIRIHCTDTATNRTEVVPVKGTKMIQIGNTPMSDGDASRLAIEELLSWIQVARNVAPLTVLPNDRNGGNRGGGSGGGSYQPQSGGGAPVSDDSPLPF